MILTRGIGRRAENWFLHQPPPFIIGDYQGEDMKTCTICGENKQIDLFGKDKRRKDGFGSWCKECIAIKHKERHLKNKDIDNRRARDRYEKDKSSGNSKRKDYLNKTKKQRFLTQKKYRELNKEEISFQKKERYIEKKEEILEKRKKYYVENKNVVCKRSLDHYHSSNKEKHLERCKKWVENNLERRREIAKNFSRRYRSTMKGRLSTNLSQAVYSSLIKGMKAGRHWETLVGYTVDHLKQHLEKQFSEYMTWENYGEVWHIDHIIPIAAFNFEKPEDEDFKKCWELNNLRPLIANVNMSKGAKLEKPFQQSLIF